MFSGFCGLFDKDHKNNVINHQKLIVQMSGKNHWIQKRKIYLYSIPKEEEIIISRKNLTMYIYICCIIIVILYSIINTRKHVLFHVTK